MASSNTVRVYSIPHVVEEDELVEALQNVLGGKSIVSCKIYRHRHSGRSRGTGLVQLREEKAMGRAVDLANEGRFSLYNQELKFEIVGKKLVEKSAPMCLLLENCTLSVGCWTSQDKMSSLWSYSGALEVELDTEQQTFAIQLRFTSIDYRMEFLLSNVRQFERLHVNGRNHGFLLQVCGVFAIRKFHQERWYFRMDSDAIHRSGQVREIPPYLYRRPSEASQTNDKYLDVFINGCLPSRLAGSESESWRKGWVRTTDFTVSSAIGQSSAYVVEFDGFDHWQGVLSLLQLTGSFRSDGTSPRSCQVRDGVPYAAPQVVVPTVNPGNFRVPFDILYKVNSLIQYGKLCGPSLDERFFKLISSGNQSALKLALQALSTRQDFPYDPAKQLRTELDELKKVVPPAVKLDKGKAWIHRVLVTPTKVYCIGPEVEQSNRIVRQYEDITGHFLRVNFVDEDCNSLTSTALTSDVRSGHSDVYRRVKEVLKEGIFIGNRKYEFLAFSASQLRESQLWMFAEKRPSPGSEKPAVTANSIRSRMGDFSQIRNVAKCAARMGQCFSSSIETRKVLPLQVKKIKDIIVKSDGVTYCFSDGIGKISKDFARSIAGACGSSGRIPSAFQIRYGGYKGVVAVDPRVSSSFKLYLRPSMRKFDSSHFSLEVLDWTRPLPCFLNRQVISLLSTLGVKDHAFIHLQNQMLSDLEHMLEDDPLAMKVIRLRETGSRPMALQMLENGYTSKTEPLLKRLVCVFRDAEVHDLKTKAKIFVPKGRLLMGCLDETKTLKYGEVFIQISGTSNASGLYYAAEGNNGDRERTSVVTQKVFVAKNPCLHPGDVRVLQAVDVPFLHHMVDCVVFPQVGPKPHPYECSGSDLDGDQYLVSWDESLVPPSVDTPMDYSPPAPTTLDHSVTIEEIQEFFVNYMTNDNLGVIANAHVVHADKESNKARSEKCLELAHLASLAVDFPKTGVPAVIPPELRPREYPDFMEKEHKVSYISNGILGKLYRSVKDTSSDKEVSDAFMVLEDSMKFFDKDLIVSGYEKHVESASFHKKMYDMKLIQLMNYYGISDEAEIIGGHVLSLSKIFARRQIDILPKVRMAFEVLKADARSWFSARRSDKSEDEATASAWYHVTYHEDYCDSHEQFSKVSRKSSHLLSFPWVVADVLFAVKRRARRWKQNLDGNRTNEPDDYGNAGKRQRV